MQNAHTLDRFSLTAFALALFVAFGVGAGIVVIAQSVAQVPAQTRLTNAAAEQSARLVLQELERERIDQLNARAEIEALRARSAANSDLQMVLRELERERFPQVFAKSVDTATMSCRDPRASCDR